MTRAPSARLQRALTELERSGSVALPGRSRRLWMLAAASLLLSAAGLAVAVGAVLDSPLVGQALDSPAKSAAAACAFVVFGLAGGWLLPQQALRRGRGIVVDREGVRTAGGGLVRWPWIVTMVRGDRSRSATLVLDRPVWSTENRIGEAVFSARSGHGALALPPLRGLEPWEAVAVLEAAAAAAARAHGGAPVAVSRSAAHDRALQALLSSGRAVLRGRPLHVWLLVVLTAAFAMLSAAMVLGPLSDLPFGSSRYDSPIVVVIGAVGALLFGVLGVPLLVRKAARQGHALVLDREGVSIEGGPRIGWREVREIAEGDGSAASATLHLDPAAMRAHVAAQPGPLRLLMRGAGRLVRAPLLTGLGPTEVAALLAAARAESLRR